MSWNDRIESGDDVKALGDQLQSDFGLTIAAFKRLTSLFEKDAAAALDLTAEILSDAEWDEVRSVLVQSLKAKLYPAWRQEEATEKLVFGASDFWVSLSGPKLGQWPPPASRRSPRRPRYDLIR